METSIILENISLSQNKAAKAVKVGDLGKAHTNLKAATIAIFENVGANEIFDLQFAVKLFLIFFRAAFYLENKSGNFAYRYQAIPGQLGNACYFQLKLAKQDASGYTPCRKAVKECASVAHKLLSQYAQTVVIQTTEQRAKQLATSYPRENIAFVYDSFGYPIVEIIGSVKGKELNFSQPRFFDFVAFKKARDASAFLDPFILLEKIENYMFTL